MKMFQRIMNRLKRVTATQALTIFGVLLMTVGVVAAIPAVYFDLAQNSIPAHAASLTQLRPTLPKNNPTHPSQPVVSGYPVSISFPNLGITKQLIPGTYDASTNSWTLSDIDAQYATMTVEPNNAEGLTFIYGHALKTVFGPLLAGLKTGDTAQVTTSNGYTFTYQLVGSYPVSPADTSILSYSGPPKLLVQTCSGLFWQNRQMFSFDFVGYAKN